MKNEKPSMKILIALALATLALNDASAQGPVRRSAIERMRNVSMRVARVTAFAAVLAKGAYAEDGGRPANNPNLYAQGKFDLAESLFRAGDAQIGVKFNIGDMTTSGTLKIKTDVFEVQAPRSNTGIPGLRVLPFEAKFEIPFEKGTSLNLQEISVSAVKYLIPEVGFTAQLANAGLRTTQSGIETWNAYPVRLVIDEIVPITGNESVSLNVTAKLEFGLSGLTTSNSGLTKAQVGAFRDTKDVNGNVITRGELSTLNGTASGEGSIGVLIAQRALVSLTGQAGTIGGHISEWSYGADAQVRIGDNFYVEAAIGKHNELITGESVWESRSSLDTTAGVGAKW